MSNKLIFIKEINILFHNSSPQKAQGQNGFTRKFLANIQKPAYPPPKYVFNYDPCPVPFIA